MFWWFVDVFGVVDCFNLVYKFLNLSIRFVCYMLIKILRICMIVVCDYKKNLVICNMERNKLYKVNCYM